MEAIGKALTNFQLSSYQVTVQATCITLMAMSMDRCYATLYPLQSLRYRTPHVAMTISFAIWVGEWNLLYLLLELAVVMC